MPVLYRDIETRSTLSLADVGAWRYADDSSTEVLCVAYAVDDGAIEIWTPGQPIPQVFFTAADNPDWSIVAHNDHFERAIESMLLEPRYGWPITPIDRHRCTLAAALANALPGALDAAAAALGLPYRKDKEGHKLMMAMSKPRRPRKGEDPNIVRWHDDFDRRLRLQAYCARDVEVERALYRRLPPLSAEEQTLWELDAAINSRGFHVDLELAEAAQRIVDAEQAAIDAEITKITDGKITSINQVEKLGTYIREQGHEVSGLTKRSVSALLAHQSADDVRRLLELRQQGAQAAARKLASLLGGVDDDHRLRGTLRYHGASTGRWSGTRFQPQNLKKAQTKNLDAAIAAVRSGDLEAVRALGAPLAIVGDLSRSMICAKPGHVLYGADFSAIESRVLAWLAGETWKLDIYRRFDETGDPALEPYCVSATKILKRPITPEDESGRALGKLCDLAFGFGGGLGAWRRFDRSNTYTDTDVQNFKNAWRFQHAATVRFWDGLEGTLRRVLRTGQRFGFKNLAAEIIDSTLYLILPSGRRLAYPQAHLEPGKFEGSVQICFKDNARGGWTDTRGWRGTFTENCVQAVARDLLAASMMRLEDSGYLITLHCHDEAVAETKDDFGSLEEFLSIMTTVPDWAAGVPLAAKAWRRLNYAKPQKEPTTKQTGENDGQQTSVHAAQATGTSVDLVQGTGDSRNNPLPERRSLATAGAAGAVSVQVSSPRAEGEGSTPVKVNGTAVIIPAKQPSEFAHIPLAGLIGQPLLNGKIVCPFHADTTPSLHIYPGNFHCFVCGAHGDHIDWLMMTEGMTRAAALAKLTNWDGPVAHTQHKDPEEEARRRLAAALRLWDASKPITGTKAIKYLADVRGIDTDLLPGDDNALRYHPRCPFGPGATSPCLIALYRDVETDAFAGIHRIALTDDVLFAGGKVERRTLGHWPSPRAVKLWPTTDQLFLGEGIETVLAAATRLSHHDQPMRPAWAAGNARNIAKFPVLADVKHLIVLADHDQAGKDSAHACQLRWRAAGRDIAQLWPKRAGTDFNDLVLEQRRVTS